MIDAVNMYTQYECKDNVVMYISSTRHLLHSPSPPLRFFTLCLHLQSGVPAHYAHAPEHVYASLARTRASPLARPSPLCHAQLSLTYDLTPCPPLTRTCSLLCAVWRFSWVGGWNREFGGPTPRTPSSVKYGPYSSSDTQGRKPRFCG